MALYDDVRAKLFQLYKESPEKAYDFIREFVGFQIRHPIEAENARDLVETYLNLWVPMHLSINPEFISEYN
jgi:hypothetical protein